MLSSNNFPVEFWDIVSQCGTTEEAVRSVTTSLSKQVLGDFWWEFESAVRSLGDHLRTHHERGSYPSEDGMYDIAALIVSKGRRYFDTVVANPSMERMDVDASATLLIGIPGQVYWERFGEEISLRGE